MENCFKKLRDPLLGSSLNRGEVSLVKKTGVQTYSSAMRSPAKSGGSHGPHNVFYPPIWRALPEAKEVKGIFIHSQKDRRFRCTECHKTFSATKGTVFYRLRTAAETVSLVVTLLAHGCPLQAVVAAFGFDERTVADWWARSGRQGQAVHESAVEQPRDLGQVKPMNSV